MQPIPNGPNIPDELLRLHAEGKVVFFCGAGISYPAGLPGFRALVQKVYRKLGEEQTAEEKQEFRRENYDRCLFLLEKRLHAPDLVRKAVFDILSDVKNSEGAIHETLLHLATTETGKTRIVTTNFDRLFEQARTKLSCEKYVAPFLPIVSHDDWSGLVYLHGLLPEEFDPSKPTKLVLSSGDFGAAYLVDRWAARFLSSLFAHYTVCFIGYSLNDPIVRYLTDSLDAARLHGESSIEHFAFCTNEDISSWQTKGITPIGYKTCEDDKIQEQHGLLYSTLKEWCNSIRIGDDARTKIVTDCVWRDPGRVSPDDDFVGRMLWALDDPTGEAAKAFSDAELAYPFEWLQELSRLRFNGRHKSVLPFPEDRSLSSENRYSFLFRPILSPNGENGFLSMVSEHSDICSDPASPSLTTWFCKHLADWRFFFWAVQQQGRPRPFFLHKINLALADHGRTVSTSGATPVAEPLRTLWRWFVMGRTQFGFSYETERLLEGEINRYGWTPFAFELLQKAAKPVFRFVGNEYVGFPLFDSDNRVVGRWQLNLSCIALAWRHDWQRWAKKLPKDCVAGLTIAERLLNSALDMMGTLRLNDDEEEFSAVDLFANNCNRAHLEIFPDLALLGQIVRDIWLVVARNDPNSAKSVVDRWIRSDNATFNRLAFFAAAKTNLVPSEEWMAWLLENDQARLWLSVFKREVCRLFALRGKSLSNRERKMMVDSILGGPVSRDGWRERDVDAAIWVRLLKLEQGGVVLPARAKRRLASISKSNPALRTYRDETEEFPDGFRHWDGSRTEDCMFFSLPDDENKLLVWLEAHPESDEFDVKTLRYVSDDWKNKCCTDPGKCLRVLLTARSHGKWLVERWWEALVAWCGLPDPSSFVPALASAVSSFGTDELLSVAAGLSSFLKYATPKSGTCYQSVFKIASLLLTAPIKVEPEGRHGDFDYAEDIAEALMKVILPFGDGTVIPIPEELKQRTWSVFSSACSDDKTFSEPVKTKVRLAMLKNAHLFFVNDRNWTERHLLPFLRWAENPESGMSHWKAFLMCSSFPVDLLREVKEDFFRVADHLPEFGKTPFLSNYYMLLFWLAYHHSPAFPKQRIRKCLFKSGQTGFDDFFQRLKVAATNRGSKGAVFWREKCSRLLAYYLPPDDKLRSKSISESLAITAIWSGEEFPCALKFVRPYLKVIDGWYPIVASLEETKQCENHPEEALELMRATIDPSAKDAPVEELDRCLNAIEQRRPDLKRRLKPFLAISKTVHVRMNT